jgi:predicted small integral membrane protein
VRANHHAEGRLACWFTNRDAGYSREMTADEPPHGSERAPEPGGGQMLVAIVALFLIVLAIVGLVALTAWVALVAAVLLMIVGVFAVTRYVQRISLTRRSGARLESELSGANRDLAVTDDAHTQISRHDIPVGEPERMAAPPTSELDRPGVEAPDDDEIDDARR